MERRTLLVIWMQALAESAAPLTPTSRLIVLHVPRWPGHLAGQHLDVRLTAPDGYQASRSYSIVSDQDGRLAVDLDSPTDRTVSWPVTATEPSTRSIEFPNGEGQSIPVDDPFWWSKDSHLTDSPWGMTDNVTMPFWGTTFGGAGVSYIVDADTDIGTQVAFAAQNERLSASAEHSFDSTRRTSTFRVTMAATDGNPVAAAQDYRRLLLSRGGITTLDEKIAANPQTRKLLGAVHGYLWGDGDDPTIVSRLKELGIQNAWLGYNADVASMSSSTVQAVTDAGYLAAPYDSWENAQDPSSSDSSSSVWPGDIWPNGCVTDENGDRREGFAGRGCTLSTSAMANAEADTGVLTDRVRTMTANNVPSYFLDVDATGDLAHDVTPAHPQTEAQDRKNRIDRLEKLAAGGFSDGKPLVVGSEKAEWWANPALAFSHGSSTPISNGIWTLQKDKKQWGGYWPAKRPAFFFTPVALSDALAKEMVDPRFRVPLYETVLHDSVVSTDRWEMGLYKFEGWEKERILSTLLTNTPAMLALDHRVLDEHGQQIAAMQALRLMQNWFFAE
ncbi:glycoside hydrolase [Rathayibacter tritici]|uniref:glycoside hydrolase n=2 Tax=Rathayibacter tritici TaxID=33888 RepID=UPI001CA54242|nr:glycoside hydrolase [Rathayibacter tritici]